MGKTLIGSLGNLLNRAPAAPNAPVPYASRSSTWALPFGQRRDAESQMRAMGAVGTLFAIVNRTSNATALVTWHLYRKAKSGRSEDRVEVTSHAALDLWERPNGFMPRQEFVETFQQHVDLCGEGWWVAARDPRSPIPLELWPVRPDRMTPVPDRDKFLAGYMYTGPDGEQIRLELDDVIFLRMPNPLDPYRGMGPVQSILADLDAARYSAEWNRNFFMNSAEPGGIIQVDGRLGDDEFEELRTRWNEQHRGVANAHRVAILEQGQWVDRKLSQRDMQFAELRSVSRDVIREAFGIPAFALGEVADVNRATAEASKVWFAEQLTVPRLERIKGALNHDLLPLFGATAGDLEFDYDNPTPPDRQTAASELTARANAAKALRDAGWEPDAILSAVGLPEIAYAGAPAPVQPSARAVAAGPTARRALPAAPVDAWDAAVAALVNTQDSGDLAHVRADQEDALANLIDQWTPIEDTWITALGQQVQTAVDNGDAPALASLAVDSDRAAGVLREALGGMAQRAAGRMVEEAAAQGVTIEAPEIDTALTNRVRVGSLRAAFGSELVEFAVATASLLGSGLASSAGREALRLFTPGADGAGIGEQVKGFLRGLSNRLKLDQLGGALHRATNVGRLATLEAAPVATYTASEVNDSNRCGPCTAIDGTVFADLTAVRAEYGAGPYRLCEGGIRCRGTVVATWDQGGEG